MAFRKVLLLPIVFFTIISSYSQETKNTSFSLYGFVRSDFFSDSRKIYSSVQDLFSFYPLYKNPNIYGDDLNAISSAGLSSVTTRLGLNFNSPGLFGSLNKSVIEVDFGGSPNFWVLRIRQAYTQLRWNNSELLVGQTWHPLFTRSMMPNLLSLNTGSPFQPFNRSPQVLFNYISGKIKFTTALVYQMMYSSTGPEGNSYAYQRNAIIPDIYLGTEFNNNGFQIGVGANYKSILPERLFLDPNGENIINKKLLSTPAAMVFSSYNHNLFSLKAKILYGQNLTEHAIIGGYAITPDHEYISYNSIASFLNLNYGKFHQIGLFAGYSGNLGPSNNLPANSKFYGFGVDKANTVNEKLIDHLYRLTPSYSYNDKNWKVGAELEYTNASWGSRSAIDGKIVKPESSGVYRICAILMYSF